MGELGEPEPIEEKHDFTMVSAHTVLGVRVIDEQHANLCRIVNNLQLACSKSQDSANNRFIQAAHEMTEFVKFHFGTEEKLMALSEYSDLEGHKREHSDFVWQILSHSEKFNSGENAPPQQFVSYLTGWINEHIAFSDKRFTDYFLQMQHHNKLRLILAANAAQQSA